MKHKLSIQAPARLLVEKYMIEIAKSYNIPYEPDAQVLETEKGNYCIFLLKNTLYHVLGKDAFLIDLSDRNNLGGGGGAAGGFPAPPGFFGYPQPPPLPPMANEYPRPAPFDYPVSFYLQLFYWIWLTNSINWLINKNILEYWVSGTDFFFDLPL